MRISEEGRTAIAYADANLTFSNRRELKRLASAAVERGARTVIVDMRETEYVDTAAWSTLAMLAHHVRVRGGAFCLTNVRPELAALLVSLRLDTFLPIGSPEHQRAD
jgi:anti-anti-sigma factor